ncbi:phage tail protein [Aeromonas hydrophila]|uniref:phage tail-collar fiber domain-containing protein n=1 Tax=Aeromonas hydrophila TaxID=644 RepID=UPI003D193B3F
MSQTITDAFIPYFRDCMAAEKPVILDEFVLANIPGVTATTPVDPASGLPAANRIVYRHAVDQRGRVNNDAVAYTIVLDTSVGDFQFNAMYLINKATGLVGMIVYKGLESKTKSDTATGKTGNSIVKSILMEYDYAAEATATHVDASTWQIDYSARLHGMDEDLRLQTVQLLGSATFYATGFELVNKSGSYMVQPGTAYIEGLRATLDVETKVTPSAKPTSLWIDIYRAGSVVGAWVNHYTLKFSAPALAYYVDSNGYQHYVAKIATINADNTVTDARRKRKIALTGDVTGEAVNEDANGVSIATTVKDDSHAHTIATITGLQAALDAKASGSHTHAISNVTGLQTALDAKADSSHTHTIGNVTGLQTALDAKAGSSHTHTISNVTGLQTELDAKANSSHTHTIGNVTGLQTALDAKVDSSHTHTIGNVTGLQTALDAKAASNHTHTAAQSGATMVLAANGGDSSSVAVDATGKTWGIVYVKAYNRHYPVSFVVAVAGKYGIGLINRGGENADHDYDPIVAVSVSGNTLTLTAGWMVQGIGEIYLM